MNIIIERKIYSKTCCIGELKIYDGGRTIYECFTLEESIESAGRGKDHRIPEGEYRCFWHEKSRFKESLTKLLRWTQDPLGIYNDEVSRDRYILFHVGNTHKDTQGCILLGEKVADDKESILSSRIATKGFYETLNRRNSRTIQVIIRNNYDK